MTAGTRQGRVKATDVAQAAGVSRATVGFVLNNTAGITISKTTADRVRETAERLGYRPHSAAQALARGSSNVVLMALPDWPIEYTFRRHLEETERRLNQAGYSMITYTKRAAPQARPLWEVLAPDVVIGIVPFTAEELAALRAAGIERVFPDAAVDLEENPFIRSGPELQVQHLAERGHRTLAYAAPADERHSPLSSIRERTARREAERLGLNLIRSGAVSIDGLAGSSLEEWLAAGVTGVISFNDDVAAAVIHKARDLAIGVPDQLAVIGYDDTPLARLFFPSITSVRIETAELGRHLAEVALASVAGNPAPPYSGARAVIAERESTATKDASA
ncbi:LacI family DNA-binding transcriptional regulator [Pseudarthrobacter sp. NPDC058329]|uniref:LacI family DNA-binding transcriptional regulator n=1 Tax=Pseudarthrobacter sp. NPDC058329 TaxID=3346448 RepID=UPI0036DA470E